VRCPQSMLYDRKADQSRQRREPLLALPGLATRGPWLATVVVVRPRLAPVAPTRETGLPARRSGPVRVRGERFSSPTTCHGGGKLDGSDAGQIDLAGLPAMCK